MTTETEIVDYDPRWPAAYDDLRQRIWPAVADLAVRIDHIGSTAVPGLAAKPIIDMDIVVADECRVRPVIERLAEAPTRARAARGLPAVEYWQPQ